MEESNELKVDLQKDACKEYAFWSAYIQQHKNIAAIYIGDTLDYKSPLNATAKNLRNKAKRLGYTCRLLDNVQRNELLPQIHAINISKEQRQGREMSESYKQMPKAYTGDILCRKHYGQWIGCFNKDGLLVAYIVANICGSLCASSMILGHGDYMRDGIMYLLYDYFMCFAHGEACDVVVYSRWSDGTDGLRVFKHNVGMSEKILIEA